MIGLFRQRLADERRHHAAVVQPHARAVGVEDADNAGLDLVFAVIGHRHGLGKTLGFVVTAARADGVDVAPVFFGLRMHQRVAVNFRGGGDQEARVFVLGQAERLVRAQRADLQGLDRDLQVINRAGGRGEMPDVIHRRIEENKFRHVLLDEFEIRVAAQMRDVVHRAGDKIVDANDFVAARQQQVGQMRAEKTGGAGDDGNGWGSFQYVKWFYCELFNCSFDGVM